MSTSAQKRDESGRFIKDIEQNEVKSFFTIIKNLLSWIVLFVCGIPYFVMMYKNGSFGKGAGYIIDKLDFFSDYSSREKLVQANNLIGICKKKIGSQIDEKEKLIFENYKEDEGSFFSGIFGGNP
jgi:hypothetical protein